MTTIEIAEAVKCTWCGTITDDIYLDIKKDQEHCPHCGLTGHLMDRSGVLTNSCTCQSYNEDLGDFQPAPECWGDCWRDQVEEFEVLTKDLRDSNETYWWRVDNLRLWSGEVSGYFQAKKVEDLIAGMTVKSEWILRYSVFADRIEYSLSHHDAMGSNSVLRGVSEAEYEDKVRY